MGVMRSERDDVDCRLDARHLRDPVPEGGNVAEYGGRQRQRAAPRERYDTERCTAEHGRPARITLRNNIII